MRAWYERQDADRSSDKESATKELSTKESSTKGLAIVAINEIASQEAVTYLTTFDSTHGRFPAAVSNKDDSLLIAQYAIALYQQADHRELPWGELAVDLVLECTGKITTMGVAEQHIKAGARQVLLSNPGEAKIPALVYGVNHQQAHGDMPVLSAASCTSNALVPVLSVLDEAFGIENGVITTIHASMHDQPVIDAYHSSDLRRNRAASQSIIPVDTALAQGIGRILPKLQGKFVAHALRVPVNNVSALNVTINLSKKITVEQVNECLRLAAEQQLLGILGYTEALLASCDFNHDSHSGIVDAQQTRVSMAKTVNILIWFDNEWAFANRMLDLALYLKDS